MKQNQFQEVVIVGAGPAGLLLALLLAKAGITVQVLEASDKLDEQPRAAHYGPAAIPELRRAGLLDEIRRRGLTLHTTNWRRLEDHSYIAGLDCSVLKDVDGDVQTACFALHDLLCLMLDEFVNTHHGSVSWKCRVSRIGQDEGSAWVECQTPDGTKTIHGDYIVGCDGASSAIRKGLFGDDFPGFTWYHEIVATNTYYPFDQFGFGDAELIIHPTHFCIAAILDSKGLYRVTYAEESGLTRDQLLERLPAKFQTILPGHPAPGSGAYKVVNVSPYKMHQRCAKSFRVGRFLLAADAAHLCNPFGGLGITGGFVDVGGLYDCLYGIWTGQADTSILDLYSEKRREKWKTIIDKQSTENLLRVSDKDPATRLERDHFLQLCEEIKRDKSKELDFHLASLDMRYDFAQHYNR